MEESQSIRGMCALALSGPQGCLFPRILLPRTAVNKGKKKGRGIHASRPFSLSAAYHYWPVNFSLALSISPFSSCCSPSAAVASSCCPGSGMAPS